MRPEVVPLVVLLFTLSHIELLEEGHQFVPDLLRQTHEDLELGQAIDVLLAVVDKLSSPAAFNGSEQAIQQQNSGKGSTGNGVSVMLLDSEDAAPNLWTHRDLSSIGIEPTARRRSTVAFEFDTNTINPQKAGETPPRHSHPPSSFQLPVANTIFTNGRLSTIQAQRWIVNKNDPALTFDCVKTAWLDKQVLRLPSSNWCTLRNDENSAVPRVSSFARHDLHWSLRASIPLTPITLPRVVAAAMGNVVRSFFTGGSEQKVMPASQELEAGIDRWIAEHGNGAQPPEVWALVSPMTNKLSDRPTVVYRSIAAGSRLHKVLSGGGGWGNKKGLLALDPELDFDGDSEPSAISTFEYREKLSEIVSPGDTVEFFVGIPELSPSTELLASNTRDGSSELMKQASMVFGTTTSTTDVMPASSVTAVSESESSPCIYAWGHFGMLSEQGVSLTTTTIERRNVQTKIDVPHATFTLVASPAPSRTKQLRRTGR